MAGNYINQSTSSSTIGDILEKILDKGVVIAGDISIAIANVELLTIRIRLIIASIDKAKEMGIDWWMSDPNLSTKAKLNAEKQEKLEENKKMKLLEAQNTKLLKRMEKLETKIEGGN